MYVTTHYLTIQFFNFPHKEASWVKLTTDSSISYQKNSQRQAGIKWNVQRQEEYSQHEHNRALHHRLKRERDCDYINTAPCRAKKCTGILFPSVQFKVRSQALLRGKSSQHPGQRAASWDFPGGPGTKTVCSQCTQLGFDPWLGN